MDLAITDDTVYTVGRLRLVARRDGEGSEGLFFLTTDQRRRLGTAPEAFAEPAEWELDAAGRLLHRGRPSGHTADDLVPEASFSACEAFGRFMAAVRREEAPRKRRRYLLHGSPRRRALRRRYLRGRDTMRAFLARHWPAGGGSARRSAPRTA